MREKFGSLVYVAGDTISRLGKFFGYIFLTHTLSVSDFLIFSLLLIISQYFGFLDFGYTTYALSISRRYLGRYVQTRIKFVRLITASVVVICFVVSCHLIWDSRPSIGSCSFVIGFSIILLSLNKSWYMTAIGKILWTALIRFSEGLAFLVASIIFWSYHGPHTPALAATVNFTGVLFSLATASVVVKLYQEDGFPQTGGTGTKDILV